jgi:subtilisin family serine protease
MQVRSFVLALLATALAATSVSSGAAAGAESSRLAGQAQPARQSQPAQADGQSTTITLITGDQVLMTKGTNGYSAAPIAGPGREGVRFSTHQKGDSIWVYPSDTAAQIASGRLDRRLFEVTALAGAGYADGERDVIPLIVQHSRGKPVRDLPRGAAASRELPSAAATAVEQKKQTAASFWKWLAGNPAGVERVWLDGQVHASLDRSVPQVGAPAAWAKGYTGKGVKVAVLDSGIDRSHLDLKGAVTASRNFSSSFDDLDHYGHGTHVASIITGDGARSAGKYKGVAPDATLLNGKILGDNGIGYESDVIAGMEWAVAQQAKVVNLSFSGGWENDGTDLIDVALNQLSISSGALFVVSAGNEGPNRYTIESPGTAAEALTVAATNRNQTTASTSSAGPRIGDYLQKPDLAAPGTGIVAARVLESVIGTPVNTYYTAMSGTSQAAAHVTGAAAILAQQQPTWNARLLKTALMGTAKLPVDESAFRQGAGFLDVSRAVTQKVFALESSVSADVRWPYPQQVTRQLTYRNPNATPLTLSLGFAPKDQNGTAAPAGLFTMPATVTVPARTTAKVTLAIDPSKTTPGRQYQGRITATATGITVRTPVSVNFEIESYDVALEIIDRAGNRVDDWADGQLSITPYLINVVQGGNETFLQLRDGRFVARMPRGAYAIATHLFTPSEDDPASLTLLHNPRFTVTAPTTLTLDAREAVRTKAVVQAEGARTRKVGMSLSQQVGSWTWTTVESYGSDVAEPVAYALPGQTTSRPYDFLLYQQLSAPDREYELALGNPDGVPADPTFAVADSDLADVSVVFAAQSSGMTGTYHHLLTRDFGGSPPGFASSYDVSMPSTRRHLISATVLGEPAEWQSALFAYRAGLGEVYSERGRVERFEAGRPGTIKLGTAAFSPQGAGRLRADYSLLELGFGPYNSSGGGDITGANGTHTGDIVLKRDGVQIAQSSHPRNISVSGLPPGPATYTAVMHASRAVSWSPYAPTVSGTWTFKATVPTTGSTPLNVISTRVSGAFDTLGRAPAGTTFPLTLDVDGAAGGVATATTRVSYDDGQTWTSVPVSNASGKWVATVTHPANPASQFVSLRIVVTDQQGNSGGWTATRAYQLATS